ncbi:MAG: family 78 glycoside hydrolase catalytic domain [Clostridia bacterium]
MFEKAKWVTPERFFALEPLDLRGKEILCQDNPLHPMELRNAHFLYRMKFFWDGKGQVRLLYSADDIAKVYVNGHFLQMGPVPCYHFRYDCNEMDITPHLHQGENVVGAHVYYQGELNRVWPSGDFRLGFIGEIRQDGSLIAYTGEKTKVMESRAYRDAGITGYRTQYLEDFDANEWDEDWCKAGFEDDFWKNASIKENNDHIFYRQESKALAFYDVLPVTEQKLGEGTILYDFGCEYAGTVSFEAEGRKGEEIEVRCAEELDENGRARYDMRCNCFYKQKYNLSGKKGEHPEFFDYMAFRFAEIITPPGVRIRNVRLIARNHPFEEEGTWFRAGNKKLNDIWAICKNGVRTGTQEAYLDCPTREKGLYLGDMTISAQSHFYLTGDASVYKRALRGFGISTYYLPTIQTTCLNHYFNSLVDYSFQFPLNLLIYYKHTGDKEFLEEMLPHCETMMESYRAYERQGLLYDMTSELHLVDWPRNPYDFSDGYDYDLGTGKTTGTHNVVNAFHIGAHMNMNEIYAILEKPACDRVESLKKAYLEAFYDPERKLFKDTMESSHCALHSNILPLYYGIAPEESIGEIIRFIRKKRLNCGVYMAYFLLKALARHKEYELVYDLISSEDDFSWYNMVREGASTCFEVWGKEYKWNTSLCHPWASAPIPVIIEDLLGISPLSPGWKDGYLVEPSVVKPFEGLDICFLVNGYPIRMVINALANSPFRCTP